MSESPNLRLPFIEAAQAQKHVTHNEAIALLDALTQMSVADMAAASPPASPAEGARVVVGASPAGAFQGHAGEVAFFDAGAWRFAAPEDGWLVWSAPDACAFVRSQGQWRKLESTIRALENLSHLGVATGADDMNPLSMRGPNALFTARYGADGGAGDLRVKLNKEAADKTVSQLYQTNWSGRAETGLIGSDSWCVRRSSDGAVWTTSLVVDPGRVCLPPGSPSAPGASFIGDEDTGLHRPGENRLGFTTGGVARWEINWAGSLHPTTNGVYSLGTETLRPHLIYCWDTIFCNAIEPASGFRIGHPAQGAQFSLWGDGDMLFRGRANQNLSRLIMGGSPSSAFPALKRSGATLQVRLADDSGFTRVMAETFECAGAQSRFRVNRRDNDAEAGVIYSASGNLQFRNTAALLDVLTLTTTGVSIFAGPVRLPSYTVATAPSASAAGAGAQIFVSNESGGATPAFSDGAVWRRVADRAAIS